MLSTCLAERDFVPMRIEDIEDSLPGRFERQVKTHGRRLAVKYGVESLTYEELDRRSNQIANALLARSGHRAMSEVGAVLAEELARLRARRRE